MTVDEFDYNLPKELIANEPIHPRDYSNLLVLNRKTGDIEHKKFCEIVDYLGQNDVLVLNNTKVIPARLFGEKEITHGKVEILLIRPDKEGEIGGWPAKWRVIGSPKLRQNQIINFGNNLQGIIESETERQESFLNFNKSGEALKKNIFKLGSVPLPPYIKHPTEKSFKNYQTVYAEKEGSVAAPTAGFHFTKDLIKKLKEKGVEIEFLTLNVGLVTFQPIKVQNIEEHEMSREYFELSEKTAERLNKAKQDGKRIISVGTTSARVLETCSKEKGVIKAKTGWTNLFIYPGYEFKFIDALITNFHLPKSTLLILVCAFASKELIFKAYEEAIKKEYRFYSFGDAMFIK